MKIPDYAVKKLVEVEGIGPAYAEKLQAVGIERTDTLLLSDYRRVAKATEISAKLLKDWRNMIDLTRISGIGSEYSDALIKVGISSCRVLARRRPEKVEAKLKALAEKTGTQVIRKLPGASEVADWIKQAKTMETLV
jgi:predicted flap endonuclease-1-like 5' DNA nuclease